MVAALGGGPEECGFAALLPENVDMDTVWVYAQHGDNWVPVDAQFENNSIKYLINDLDMTDGKVPARSNTKNENVKGLFLTRMENGEPIVTGWCVVNEPGIPTLAVFSGNEFLGLCLVDQPRPDVSSEFGISDRECGFAALLPENVDTESVWVYARYGDNWVPLDAQFQNHGAKYVANHIDSKIMPFLKVKRLMGLKIGLITKCNLKCVYCPIRAMEKVWNFQDRTDDQLSWDESFIKKLQNSFTDILFVNSGEATMHKNWCEIFNNIIKNNISVSLLSNLSLKYNDNELDTLAKIKELGVSLDTTDKVLHSKTRINSDFDVIIKNIQAIKKRKKHPKIVFAAVMHNKSIKTLPSLANLCVDLDIDGINLMSLRVSSSLSMIKSFDLKPIAAFSLHEIEELKKNINEFIEIMESNHKKYMLSPDIRILHELKDINKYKDCLAMSGYSSGVATDIVPDGYTRNCLLPWTSLDCIDGGISVCCFTRSQIPYSNDTDFSEIINDNALIKLRHGLYTGNLEPMCKCCSLYSTISLKEFQEKVQKLVKGEVSPSGYLFLEETN